MTAELALTRPDPSMSEDALRVMMAAAQRYVASGLLPSEVNTPQKALVVMTAGREMGVPATYALRNIHVVKGKPVCSAELLLALVRRSYGPGAIRVSKTSNTACTVQYREQGWDGISEYTFTIEDARTAGVANSGTWKAYPAAMLRARCISAVVRFAFPECIAGLYTPEEMGAEVTVDPDGEVRIVDGEIVGSKPLTETGFEDEKPALCNKRQHLAYWHKAVKGTRFEDDETRHKYIAYYTKNAFNSLGAFLDQATEDEAHALIVSIERQIDRESQKAAKDRDGLIEQLRAAVDEAGDLGGNVEMPDDLDTMTNDQIRETLSDLVKAIESARSGDSVMATA
jgi:hypothetical protein